MILVDSNIILDIMTDDPHWCEWSIETLSSLNSVLAINPIIYTEVSVKIDSIEELDKALHRFQRLHLPYEAGFLAGKAFMSYRKKGGTKTTPLPDFLIGAHAAILDIPLVTRDISRYKTYYPTVELIHP